MTEAALFFTAFAAATILPFSSEAAFLVALTNETPLFHAIFFTSFGNILGILLNYALGYFLYEKMQKKLHSSSFGKEAFSLGRRYGYGALLLSWLPLVGDPLTLVAGLLRLHLFWFLLIAGSLRIGRYLILSLMV